MKKMLLIAALVAGLLFVGCEKEDAGLDKRLVGTEWVNSVGDYHYVFHFVNAREVEYYYMKNGIKQHHYGTYNYTLEYPHLYIDRTYNDESVQEFIFIDSHTMKCTTKNYLGLYEKYVKQ